MTYLYEIKTLTPLHCGNGSQNPKEICRNLDGNPVITFKVLCKGLFEAGVKGGIILLTEPTAASFVIEERSQRGPQGPFAVEYILEGKFYFLANRRNLAKNPLIVVGGKQSTGCGLCKVSLIRKSRKHLSVFTQLSEILKGNK
jgi:hypothetical protein